MRKKKAKEKSTKKIKPSNKLSKQTLLDAYKYMFRARKVDEKAIVLYKQNKCHFQIGCAGHEAVQVAAAQVLISGHDWFYPYYRDMAFVCALGMSDREFFLNILNKVDDPNSAGRMMPMHYGHKKLRIVNQSSPTGTQFLQAVGAAKAATYKKNDEIVYVSSGEGTTAQGAYFEAINWAAREKLPVIFLVEDNNFAISVHITEHIAGASVADVARGFAGLDVVEIDGLDYFASRKAFIKAAERARKGNGPSLIVAKVVRLQSHSISDNQTKYRYPKDLENEKKKDPLVRFEKELLKKKVFTKKQLKTLQAELLKEIDDAATWAEAQNDPDPETALDNVFVNPDPASLFPESERNGAEEVFMVDALNLALDEEMKRNKEMVIYGQDVAYGKGGVFSVTSGLTNKYTEKRVFNAPLAESSIIGTAIGLATVGLEPVVEIQFGDYCWTAMMDLRNELAMMCYRSNGTFYCPAVVRIPVGGYIHGGLYHSQNIEATFAHFPGFFIAYPSNAWDAKGMLKAAIRGKDPVLFLEHKGLYRQVYAKGPKGGIDDLVPLGKARVVRSGTAATIVTWGYLVQKSLVAAEQFSKEYGLEIEVIDLRTIYPLDIETIVNSIKKTNRLLIAHEDVLFMGMGAEISAQIAEHCFEYLDAPIMRVGGKYTSIPHSPVLEEAVLPQNQWVIDALEKLLAY